MDYSIAVLPGDGIGPEVTKEGVRVLHAIEERFNHTFKIKEGLIGGIAIDQTGDPLPEDTLAIAKRSDAILLGAVGGPKWDNPSAKTRPEAGLLAIRKSLKLFANLRPVKAHPELIGSSPIRQALIEGVDLLVVRELTGGLYFANPKKRWETKQGRRAIDSLKYTEQEIRRVLEIGYDLARNRRKKLTSVDKANVLESSRLWREIATEVASENPDIQTEHILVDACAMHLIQRPKEFDVIVTENMFGDILTDEASVLAGSMGMLPSASLGTKKITKGNGGMFGLYEPIHGSAPDIAGKQLANPMATIASLSMMFRLSFGLENEASAIDKALDSTLRAGFRTSDIHGTNDIKPPVNTEQITDAIIERIINPTKNRVAKPL